MTVFNYGFFADCNRVCADKFGSIETLKIIKDPYQNIIEHYSGGRVLDVGAGKEKPVQKALSLSNEIYFSLDTDPLGEFDYTSIDQIPETEKFSLITANQFFEHLSLEKSIDFVCKISNYLEKKGCLISTVPNIQHPVRQRTNITHITNWEYKALYMLYKYANIEVIDISRYSKRHPQGIIEKVLARYINRIYRMDWCDSILIVGKKQ